jgi:lipoprotein-releasing system permease protein
MSRLPFEAFLALRYLRPRRTFVSVITVISIIGVLLGVAVLIVVISVMSGFDQEWRERILGFNAHMKVLKARANLQDYEKTMKVVAQNPTVIGVAPFVTGQVLVKTQPQTGNARILGPMLLGIDPEAQRSVSILPTNIISGEFDLSFNGLLIGREFSERMNLAVGDRVNIYSPEMLERIERTRGQTNAEGFAPAEYVVHGIFDVGFDVYNSSYVITSLENAQELYDLEAGAVHGLQVKLRDPFQADEVAKQLHAELKDGFTMLTWKQENPEIFGALAMEKNMMFFLLFFIMIVAGFGIVNCQITFVVQKTREIGILKSLGANNRQVLWLFLSQSVVVGILGVGLGLGLAMLALSYRNDFLEVMRRVTGSKLLDATIYHIDQLPASIQTGDIAAICGTAFVTCVLAGLFPAWKASRLQPVEALRHE